MPSILQRALHVGEAKKFKTYEKRIARINAYEPELELEDDQGLRDRMDGLRERARNGEPLDELMFECFAIVREAGKRSMGMRHFDVQLIGAMVLHDGSIAEMKTGEGKTLTATLAVVLNSLAGKGVHVVTVNDYLARRDAEWMSPIYDLLGVKVGILQNMQPYEEKAESYGADVTYGTNSEFGFDYLRDNMATTLEEKVQRGHPYAVVDEVDNILIDEARTPLIISGAPEAAADLYQKFARLAKTMQAGKKPEGLDPRAKKDFVADYDFEFDEKHKTVSITERGVAKAERFLNVPHLYSAENGPLVNHLQQALKAESLYKRDKDYAVIDDEVKIIDEFTGRILEGRRWSEGLHQAVEAKEGVSVQDENQTLAQVTLQNYFRMYEKLAGMTGTALTEATEFMKIYKLPVVQVPTNKPMVRADQNDQIYKTKDGKWNAVAQEIAMRHEAGQPILVGTISVEVSEYLSGELTRRGIRHEVLNAKPEYAEREGAIIAEAGRSGAVTIATNMAGRGVDIKLGGNAEHQTQLELAKLGLKPGEPDYDERFAEVLPTIEARIEEGRERVIEAGGLFICGTERHESRRIDNQLRGRAGRQGDPGESRFFLSAEDDLVRLFMRRPDLQDPRPPRHHRRRGQRGAHRSRDADQADREGAEEGRGAELPHPQARPRVRRRDERAAADRLRLPRPDPRGPGDGRDRPRRARERRAPPRRRVHARRLHRGVGPRGPRLGDRRPVAVADRHRVDEGRVDRPRGARARAPRGRRLALRRPREGARRGAHARPRALSAPPDHRHAVARAPLRHGLPARGHPPPRVRPDRPARRLQERGLRALQRADERHLDAVRPDDLQRRGRGRRGGRRRRPAAVALRDRLVDGAQPRDVLGRRRHAAAQRARHGGRCGGHGPEGYAENGEGEPMVPVVEQRRLGDEEQIGRNDPCWCGSGKKFKKRHGA